MAIYTAFHVILSLIGIVSGLVVVYGFLTANPLNRWTSTFLTTTALTSVTGFFFPVPKFLPSHAVAILSLIVLGFAILARYPKHMAGGWRKTYVITSVVALYFNCFVLVVQSFEKVPALNALAPTQSEPPFAIAQGIVLAIFIGLGIASVKKFRIAAESMRARNATA